MQKGRLGAEQIVTKLRQIEVLQDQGAALSGSSAPRPVAPIQQIENRQTLVVTG